MLPIPERVEWLEALVTETTRNLDRLIEQTRETDRRMAETDTQLKEHMRETDRRMAELIEQTRETDRRMAETDAQLKEHMRETDRRMAELIEQTKETDRRMAETDAQLKEHMRETDRRMAELIEQTKETDRRMAETDAQLKEHMRETDRRMAELIEQTKETDRRMAETDAQLKEQTKRREEELRQAQQDWERRFEEATRRSEQEWKAYRQEMAAFSHRMGWMTEDLIIPSIPRVLTEVVACPEPPSRIDARSYRKVNGRVQEYDALTVCGDYLCLAEAKTRLRPQDIPAFVKVLQEARLFIPEHADKKIVGMLATFYVDPSMVTYGEREGLVMLGVIDGLMQILNQPGFSPTLF